MNRRSRFLFGPLGAVILALGVVGLALLVPGYDQIRQTVSEIGEVGSPARAPFALLLCTVAACILIFASALRELAAAEGHSQWPAFLVAFMAMSAAGVGVFAYPHPLHNVFGMSELIGYQAPLAFALSWRRDGRARVGVAISWIGVVLVWGAIALNLSSLDRGGQLFAHLRPVYGFVQRALFASWFAWCASLGVWLFRRQRAH